MTEFIPISAVLRSRNRTDMGAIHVVRTLFIACFFIMTGGNTPITMLRSPISSFKTTADGNAVQLKNLLIDNSHVQREREQLKHGKGECGPVAASNSKKQSNMRFKRSFIRTIPFCDSLFFPDFFAIILNARSCEGSILSFKIFFRQYAQAMMRPCPYRCLLKLL